MPYCVRIYDDDGNRTDIYCVTNEPTFSGDIRTSVNEVDSCDECQGEFRPGPVFPVFEFDIKGIMELILQWEQVCKKYPDLCEPKWVIDWGPPRPPPIDLANAFRTQVLGRINKQIKHKS